MIRNVVIILLLGAGLWACSDVYNLSAESHSVTIDDEIQLNASIDSMIAPYQDSMSTIMDEVIAYAPQDFLKGRPNAALNNWAADAIMEVERIKQGPTIRNHPPIICLLNVGGLRNPISQGDVTVGDIYKLMPFDNQIVWVELPWSSNVSIAEYLKSSGGEPISGATLQGDSLIFDDVTEPAKTFWVITSDYLMNGGDHMDFFQEQVDFNYGSGMLMRDVFIEAVKIQDTLYIDNSERIHL
ncbi:MAG: 5'-nucleotidase C-terminal domain-containing protein [Fluviicola sp.]